MPEPLAWEGDSRFHRFTLISWWDQKRLRAARVLVIGAGALGNEIVKNLALLGAGHLAVVDMDRVELSNLTRSVLFRESDCGRAKAEAACAAARSLYPAVDARPVVADVRHGVGLGLFAWADVVIGGLDSREARLAVSRACALVGRPWVDGAIDVLGGVVRTFIPGDGPCYECTLSAADWAILEQRRACTLLPRDEAAEPRVPTTPTTASVIGGMQCAEAVKLLHGMEGLRGQGFVFDGAGYDCYRVTYPRDPECYGHDRFEEIIPLDGVGAGSPLHMALEGVYARAGHGARVEACRELVAGLVCRNCGKERAWRGPLDALGAGDATCPDCGKPCAPTIYHRLDGAPAAGALSLADHGIPAWDILRCRVGERLIGFELAGDRPADA